MKTPSADSRWVASADARRLCLNSANARRITKQRPLCGSRRPPQQNIVRVAARTFDEALTYSRWTDPEFKIDRVQKLGIIILVSGSPVD